MEWQGVALSGLDRYNEAVWCYDHALAIDQNYTSAWHNKGLALKEIVATMRRSVLWSGIGSILGVR